MNHTLERFLIFNLLKKHPGITRYRVIKYMTRLQCPIKTTTLYSIFKVLEKEGFIKSNKEDVAYKPKTSRSLSKFSKKWNTGRVSNGWWNRKTKTVLLYSLTDKGFRELFSLENKIRIALDLTVNGVNI